jgi:hypothetical protein
VLSLLIALFSVVGLSVPPIIGVLREQDANLHEAIIAGRAGSIREGPEYLPAFFVDLLITNSGKLPGVVKAVAKSVAVMFLRCHARIKDGKEHR